mmetsp:Transcript_3926/g.9316  ORF Transcript_3926/g.9316 Transcript_3926/m.9316 type:complete len:247 (-) Transcript_3926:1034-1774(-)
MTRSTLESSLGHFGVDLKLLPEIWLLCDLPHWFALKIWWLRMSKHASLELRRSDQAQAARAQALLNGPLKCCQTFRDGGCERLPPSASHPPALSSKCIARHHLGLWIPPALSTILAQKRLSQKKSRVFAGLSRMSVRVHLPRPGCRRPSSSRYKQMPDKLGDCLVFPLPVPDRLSEGRFEDHHLVAACRQISVRCLLDLPARWKTARNSLHWTSVLALSSPPHPQSFLLSWKNGNGCSTFCNIHGS